MGCVSCAGFIKGLSEESNEIVLSLKKPSSMPVEADVIVPDRFVDLAHRDICSLPVHRGRHKVRLDELFEVEGEKSDRITLEGDLEHVKKVGYEMTRGRILVRGNIGQHAGAYMQGGEILVTGDAGNRTGMNMKGGRIWIKGNAGHLLGAAYPGERWGGNRGVIIVEGNVGTETGAQMRRGLIVVLGNAGDFTGAGMIAGSIFVFGNLGKRAGAGNKRGSIIALGSNEPLLPTYRFETVCRPVFVNIFYKLFRKWGLPITSQRQKQSFRRYSGDINTLGKGEILIHDQHERQGL